MLTVSYICILFSLRSCLTIISIPIERSLLQQRGIWWQEDFSSVKMWPEASNAIITADPLERYLQSRQVCKKDLKAEILWLKDGCSGDWWRMDSLDLCANFHKGWPLTSRSLALPGRARLLYPCLLTLILRSKWQTPVKQQCICTTTCKCNRRSSHP